MNRIDELLSDYDNGYDMDLLWSVGNGDDRLVTIGKLIDCCSDFKKMKKKIGSNKEVQLKVVLRIYLWYMESYCVGMNLYDAVGYWVDKYTDLDSFYPEAMIQIGV